MKKIILNLTFLSTIFFASFHVLASESKYNQNGFLCVDEICLGDSLEKAEPLSWEQAIAPTGVLRPKPVPVRTIKVKKQMINNLKNILKVDQSTLRKLAPYWTVSTSVNMDAYSIKLMKKVKALCNADGSGAYFTASYQSQSGHKTIVTFTPIPSFDSPSQKYFVSQINREYGKLTESQANNLIEKSKSRYGAKLFNAIGVRSNYTYEKGWADGISRIILKYQRLSNDKSSLRFEDHPACGNNIDISLD